MSGVAFSLADARRIRNVVADYERGPRAPRRVLANSGDNWQWVKISSTSLTSGMYPGHWYEGNAQDGYTQGDVIWIDTPNGETLSTSTYYKAEEVGTHTDGKAIFQTDRIATSGISGITVKESDGSPSYSSIDTIEVANATLTNPGTGRALITPNAATASQAGIVSVGSQTFGGPKLVTGSWIYVAVDQSHYTASQFGGVACGSPGVDFQQVDVAAFNSASERTNFQLIAAPNGASLAPGAILSVVDSGGSRDAKYGVVGSDGLAYWGAYATVGGMTFKGGLYTSGSPTSSITIGTTAVSGGTTSGVTYTDGSVMRAASSMLIDSGGGPVMNLGSGNYLAFGALEAA